MRWLDLNGQSPNSFGTCSSCISHCYTSHLWDDGGRVDSELQHFFHCVICILCNMECFLMIYHPTASKFYPSRSSHFIQILSLMQHGHWTKMTHFSFVLFSSSQKIPIWWRWYYWICPVSWTLYGLVASQFGDIDDHKLSDTGEVVSEFLRSYFGFKHSFLGVVAVVVVAFAVLFAVLFAFSIKMLNFQRRWSSGSIGIVLLKKKLQSNK